MTLFDAPTAKCDLCGPLPEPEVHDTCHKPWCGHKTEDHSGGMKCRICKQECGIWCRPMTAHRFLPISRPWGWEGETEWQCAGCGLIRRDPAAKLTDNCAALELLEPESA